MQFTPEHLSLRESAARFIEAEINPHVDAWEAEGVVPARALYRKLGRMGFLGIHKPLEDGGQGLDYSYALVFAEELGNVRAAGVTMGIGVQTDMATPALARHGSDELRAQFLRPSIAGDLVAAIGVSEVSAGSDVSAVRTVARRDGDEYVIDGGKMWITNGTQADWICLLAVTGEGPAHANKSLLAVPMDLPGVSMSRKLDKLGMRSADTAQIHFDGVRVPRRFLIGRENEGFRMQMQQFQEERIWIGATVIKALERVIRDTIDYTAERRAFGRRVLDNQVVRFRLAELQAEVELLRSLVYRAVGELVAGRDVTLLASAAKLKAGRLAREVTDACLQFFGGMGFMNETPVSRAFRDLRSISIVGGADEVMLEILSKGQLRHGL